MAEANNENRNGEIEHVSLNVAGIPRDMLQIFFSGSKFPRKLKEETAEEAEEEIELSLGLSLNGRFGVDPKKTNKLTRSSSISDFFLNQARRNDGVVESHARLRHLGSTAAGLGRTCSLPTETEEEWRKRKELQCLRRMEAKRKRTEKQRVFIAAAAAAAAAKDRAVAVEDNCEVDGNYDDEKRGEGVNGEVLKGFISPGWPLLGMSNWVPAALEGGLQSKPVRPNALDSRGRGGDLGGEEAVPPPSSSPGSIGSHGSGCGSSLISDFDYQMVPGGNKNIEARSPTSVQSLPQQNDQKPTVMPVTSAEKLGKAALTLTDSPSKKLLDSETSVKETIVKNVMEDMPYVSTIGDGPNGKKIEGFLYRYRKGEEVRIVCVCHGNFLSPAEFVKHAGGGDVSHPLRHIVVNTTALL